MSQQGVAALYEQAGTFQHLQDLELDSITFISDIRLPHVLERVAIRNCTSHCVVRLDNCKCATVALGGKHGAVQW